MNGVLTFVRDRNCQGWFLFVEERGATAIGSNYAVNDQDCRWVVIHEFEKHGWGVEPVYLGNPKPHHEKYLLINQGFSVKQRLMPFFNLSNNEDLILAFQTAGIS